MEIAGLLTVLALVLYFAPVGIAQGRGHPQTGAIFLFTLFLGWTVIGWIVALVWAASSPYKRIVTVEAGRPRPAPTVFPNFDPPGTPPAAVQGDFCPHCGRRREGTILFCRNCGARFS